MAKGGRYGKYGKGDAGIKHRLDEKDWGVKRKFIGSGTKEYIFKRPDGGILVIREESYKAALRIAESYGAKQYRRKRR